MSDDGVLVIGAGPAGLATAIDLRRRGVDRVRVIEREREPGGVPRHCAHTGFGLRDLHRVYSGPRYASRYRDRALQAGVDLVTETMVTAWNPDRSLRLTAPAGPHELRPEAVVIASGCRERPRAARLVPGSRPQGVMTTGTLQQLVHLHGRRLRGRAVIVGAEHVSFSAVATLAESGASTLALITDQPRHQSLWAFRLGASLRYRAPVWTNTELTAVRGAETVEAVELRDLDSGETRVVSCELVVFTGDWIADNELAIAAGCEIERASTGPRVDTALRTSVPGVFAAGNLLHPAETADLCALDGRHAAAAVQGYLSDPGAERLPRVGLTAEGGLRWISPSSVSADLAPPPRGRFLLRPRVFRRFPKIVIEQDGRRLWAQRVTRLVPGRSAEISAEWIGAVDPRGGPVAVRLDDHGGGR